MGTKGLGLDEQARLAEEEQGVVDRIVRGSTPVFELDVLEVLDVPAQGAEDGHDERRLRVLLADALALVLRDPVTDGGQDDLEIEHRFALSSRHMEPRRRLEARASARSQTLIVAHVGIIPTSN